MNSNTTISKVKDTIVKGLKVTLDTVKEKTVNAVTRILERRSRMRAFKLAATVQIYAILQTIDNAQSRVMHSFIDSAQRLTQALEEQSAEIESVSADFGTDVVDSSEKYNTIITKYQAYLTEAAQYIDQSWIAKSLDRRYDGRLTELLKEANSVSPSLENTQRIVDEMNTFLQKIHTRADMLHKLTANSRDLAMHAHATMDIVFTLANIVTLLGITYQSLFVAGEYW
jgi:hypothetical protein